jgi:hypothetical protein
VGLRRRDAPYRRRSGFPGSAAYFSKSATVPKLTGVFPDPGLRPVGDVACAAAITSAAYPDTTAAPHEYSDLTQCGDPHPSLEKLAR